MPVAAPRTRIQLTGGDSTSPSRPGRSVATSASQGSPQSQDHESHNEVGTKHLRQSWFAGSMSRAECENQVCAEDRQHGFFLVRLSSKKTSFVICVNDNGKPMHFEVQGAGSSCLKFAKKEWHELTSIVKYLARKAVKGKSGKMIYLRNAEIVEDDSNNSQHSLPRSPRSDRRSNIASSPSSLSQRPSQRPSPRPRSFHGRSAGRASIEPSLDADLSHLDVQTPTPKPNTVDTSQSDIQLPMLPSFDELVPSPRHDSLDNNDHGGYSQMQISAPPSSTSSIDPVTIFALKSENLQTLGRRRSSQLHEVVDKSVGFGVMQPIAVFSDDFLVCAGRDPAIRNESDLSILASEMKHLEICTHVSPEVRKHICSSVELLTYHQNDVIATPSTIGSGWWMVVVGQIVVEYEMDAKQCSMVFREGDSFGLNSTIKIDMQTAVADSLQCQVICVPQAAFSKPSITSQTDKRYFTENGDVVVITERQPHSDEKGDIYLIVQGTAPKLIERLIDTKAFDTIKDANFRTYFLMSFRTFTTPRMVLAALLGGIDENCDRVRDIVLAITEWVQKYFIDFQNSQALREALQSILIRINEFVSARNSDATQIVVEMLKLESALLGQSTQRIVTLNLTSNAEPLGFNIRGGIQYECGIFISQLKKGSKAASAGLQVGDQVLEINGKKTDAIDHGEFAALCKENAELKFLVQYNLTGLHTAYYLQEQPLLRDAIVAHRLQETRENNKKSSPSRRITKSTSATTDDIDTDSEVFKLEDNPFGHRRPSASRSGSQELLSVPPLSRSASSESAGSIGKRRSMSVGARPSGGPRPRSRSIGKRTSAFFRSFSNNAMKDTATLSRLQRDFNTTEHTVIKIFKWDDPKESKGIIIAEETTVHEIIEFLKTTWTLPEQDYTLIHAIAEHNSKESEINYEISLTALEATTKNLSVLFQTNTRFYLADNKGTSPLGLDTFKNEMQQFVNDYFRLADARTIARALTMRDSKLFKAIRSVEYIDFLWKIGPNDSECPNQQAFADSCNGIISFVINEICKHHDSSKTRSEIIRKFIKIARLCLSVNNLNSMFAIVSGLISAPVSRLKRSWASLPSKYAEYYAELEALLDPTRNMAKYRNLLAKAAVKPPLVPFFPILMKDLTFMHEGNPSKINGLINFEKLRMISSELAKYESYSKIDYDSSALLVKSGGSFFGREKPTISVAWQKIKDVRDSEYCLELFKKLAPIDSEKYMEMSYRCEDARVRRSSISEVSVADTDERSDDGDSDNETQSELLRGLKSKPDEVSRRVKRLSLVAEELEVCRTSDEVSPTPVVSRTFSTLDGETVLDGPDAPNEQIYEQLVPPTNFATSIRAEEISIDDIDKFIVPPPPPP